MPPSPADLIAPIEQALATLPADSNEYTAFAALLDQIRQGRVRTVAGPQINAVHAARDANIAATQVIVYPLSGDADGARTCLTHLAAHYGTTPDAGADARIFQQMREWRIPDENAALVLVRQRLCDGVAELRRAPVSAALLSSRAAATQVALPDGRDLPFRWAEIVLAIGCLDLVEPLITVRRAWHSSDEHRQQAALLAFAQALEQPARRASVQALLGYVLALVESGEAQADAALRAAIERCAAAPDATAQRLALRALAAAIGGASGAAAATITARVLAHRNRLSRARVWRSSQSPREAG